MNNPFVWFLVLFFGGVALIAFLARRILGTLLEQAALHAKDYSMAYAKGAALVAVGMGTQFIQVFEKVSPDEAAAYSWWSWVCKFFVVAVSGLNVYIAYVDRTMERSRDAKAERENGVPKTQ